jgi:thymidylate synthase (FAD)
MSSKSAIEIVETRLEDLPTYDAFAQLPVKQITGLLDGKASVQLVEVSPRIVPLGYTPEYLAVRAARVSFGYGLKTPELDTALLNYLLRNRHTSPIEMPNVTFRLTIPKAMAIQFLRHRTGKFNEFSQRYAEVGEEGDDTWYNPLNWDQGIRIPSLSNKQGSNLTNGEDCHELEKVANIRALYTEAETHIAKLHELYHQMIDAGLAKEIARFVLPMSEYTILYAQFDLSNLSKLLHLRADYEHAQRETAVIANAMLSLIKPLFPTIIAHLEGGMNGLSSSEEEIAVIRKKEIPSNITGSRRKDLIKKAAQLDIILE